MKAVIILFPLLILSLAISLLIILLTGKAYRSRVARFIFISYLVGAGGMVLLVLVGWIHFRITSPMSVSRGDIIGTYRVDRNMFAGPQADWQNESFSMEITESDTVILRSLDINGRWHTFKRPIAPFQGYHSYLWRFPLEGDSTAHHILANTPTLHRQQWSFYYSFRSPRFGTVFFRKVD